MQSGSKLYTEHFDLGKVNMKVLRNKRKELIRALEYNEEERASKLILNENIDLSGINVEVFRCVLADAVRSHFDTPVVYKLLNSNIDAQVRKEMLRLAISFQSASAMDELIRTGTDPTKPICSSLYQSMHPREEYSEEKCKPSILLHYLAKKGRKGDSYDRVMRVLMDHGPDLDVRDADGRNVLHYAIAGPASVELIRELLERGASVDAVSERGQSVIHMACVRPDADRLMPLLFEYVDQDTKNARAITALEMLVCDDELETIAAIRAVFEKQTLATCYTESMTQQILAIEAMLRAKCRMRFEQLEKSWDDFWCNSSPNDYCLGYPGACLDGNLAAIKIILSTFGLQIDQNVHWNLLRSALVRERPDVVEVLMEHGAEISAVSNASILSAIEPLFQKRTSAIESLLEKLAPIDRTKRDINLLKRLMDNTKFAEMYNVRLIIKIFAVLVAKDVVIDESDAEEVIQNISVIQAYYEQCLDELQKMKKFTIIDDLSAFCFFELSFVKISKLCRNADFVANYETCLKQIVTLFPIYSVEIETTFRNAEKARNIVIDVEDILLEISDNLLPQTAIRKMANYACSERLLQLQNDSFLCCSFLNLS